MAVKILPKKYNLLLAEDFYKRHLASDAKDILILGDSYQFKVEDSKALTDDKGTVTDKLITGYLMAENVKYEASNIDDINKRWEHSADGSLSCIVEVNKAELPYTSDMYCEGHAIMLGDILYYISAILTDTEDDMTFIGNVY